MDHDLESSEVLPGLEYRPRSRRIRSLRCTAPGDGWLRRAFEDPMLARRAGAELRDANGEVVNVLEIGEYAAPLPRWVG